MANFVVIDTHKPEECEESFVAYEAALKEGINPMLDGFNSHCSCPYGEHASWTPVEANSAEEILAALWPFERDHSRVVQVETMTIGKPLPMTP